MSREKNAETNAIIATLDHLYDGVSYLSRKEFLDIVVEWLDKRGVSPDVSTGITSDGKYQEFPWQELPARTRSVLDQILDGRNINRYYRSAKSKVADGLGEISDKIADSALKDEKNAEKKSKESEGKERPSFSKVQEGFYGIHERLKNAFTQETEPVEDCDCDCGCLEGDENEFDTRKYHTHFTEEEREQLREVNDRIKESVGRTKQALANMFEELRQDKEVSETNEDAKVEVNDYHRASESFADKLSDEEREALEQMHEQIHQDPMAFLIGFSQHEGSDSRSGRVGPSSRQRQNQDSDTPRWRDGRQFGKGGRPHIHHRDFWR